MHGIFLTNIVTSWWQNIQLHVCSMCVIIMKYIFSNIKYQWRIKWFGVKKTEVINSCIFSGIHKICWVFFIRRVLFLVAFFSQCEGHLTYILNKYFKTLYFFKYFFLYLHLWYKEDEQAFYPSFVSVTNYNKGSNLCMLTDNTRLELFPFLC